METVEDAEIVLRFLKRWGICGYVVWSLRIHDWEADQMIVDEEELGEIYGQQIFASDVLNDKGG